MKDLIDVIDAIEQVDYELDLMQTVMGYILDHFQDSEESVRENLKYHAGKIFNMLIISNKYLYENKNRLEEAVNMLNQLHGESNG